MKFTTPNSHITTVAAVLLFLLTLMLSLAADAEEPNKSEEPQEVTESSTCSMPMQILFGMQLVELKIDPKTLMAAAVYFRQLEDKSFILMAYVRQDCNSGWRRVKVEVIKPKRPCLSEEGCL